MAQGVFLDVPSGPDRFATAEDPARVLRWLAVRKALARRLQIQERLTSDIDAKGVGVVIECKHLCMMMRGVEKQNSLMTTSSVLGSFRSHTATRSEFMELIYRSA